MILKAHQIKKIVYRCNKCFHRMECTDNIVPAGCTHCAGGGADEIVEIEI